MKENEEEVSPIGQCAGDILQLIMERIDTKNNDFIHQSIEILTLCLSEIIRAGYCRHHIQEACDKVVEFIKEDLQNHISKEEKCEHEK